MITGSGAAPVQRGRGMQLHAAPAHDHNIDLAHDYFAIALIQ